MGMVAIKSEERRVPYRTQWNPRDVCAGRSVLADTQGAGACARSIGLIPLGDELYGLAWSRQHLEATLDGIYASGCGVLDPAILVASDS